MRLRGRLGALVFRKRFAGKGFEARGRKRTLLGMRRAGFMRRGHGREGRYLLTNGLESRFVNLGVLVFVVAFVQIPAVMYLLLRLVMLGCGAGRLRGEIVFGL